MSASSNVLKEVHGRVALHIINRPEKRNALDSATRAQLLGILDELRADAEVRVVVLTGAGDKAFVAGADISEFEGRSPIDQFRVMSGRTVFDAVDSFPKPVIAALNGFTLGGGCELAMACDIRLAADTAKLGQPEVNLGIIPGGGGTQRLARLVGPARAKDLILSGRQVDAEEAYRMGLVDVVIPADDFAEEVAARAAALAAGPAEAMRLAKAAIDGGLALGLPAGLRLEQDLFAEVFDTRDAEVGVASFNEHGPGHATFP